MQNGDFELAGYLIGRDQPVFVSEFNTGPEGDRDQDFDDPLGDTRIFGRDRTSPATWTFEFSVAQAAGQPAAAGVLESLENLKKVWRTAVDARDPGDFTTLRYMIGGRIRRVYGRPRGFVPDPSRNIEDGHVVANASFARLETLTYQDAQEVMELTLRTPPSGEVTLPAVWPLISKVTAARQGVVTVGGSAPTVIDDITFYGPVDNPMIENANWRVAWSGSIPYDGFVRIDPRRRTVLNHQGASVAGALSRRTRMRELTLDPGGQDFTFTGLDNTANARAVVRWRPAYYAL